MARPDDTAPDGRRPALEVLGPGLVTGAADDDPSGIATYSQVGAQFGYAMSWALLFSFPLMAAIQAVCAQVGASTGKGIARNLKEHYPRPLLHFIVMLLLVANVINLGADLGAMGAAVGLFLPGDDMIVILVFGLASIALEVLVSYERYASILKWATLSLLSYFAVAAVAAVDWRAAALGAIIPTFTFDKDHVTALVAVLGTTISPYLFFWQAAQEVEEQERRHTKPLCVSPRTAGAELRRIRTDTLVGMGFSNLTAIFIVIATAATLHQQGIFQIESAVEAATALRPISGDFAFMLFALGIISTGLLAVPVLAGSAAYAVTESFGWREGLGRRPREAKAFYAVITLATLAGVAMNLLDVNPMKALYWSAVVNGLLAPPLMAVTMLIARNRRAMGNMVIGPRLAFGGWLSTAVMAGVAVMFFVI
ncbi:divalent metal cation transporter [Novosphingobium sp. KCTC 2891]|uniref:NRAMP family divalent metal transporter n=1 Tax=Novosphingobium sp. KCTC 2891 TaxID=2989730 RepID=UPI002223B931|nr:divalent metal cation transporter [Novosphingobium sp. KCTC 2891]MCW1383050.1 divalent metal cation transporter [Novosphingobium sp. KCTC 2891]